MTSGAANPARRRRGRTVLRWLLLRRKRPEPVEQMWRGVMVAPVYVPTTRRQRRYDRRFWAIVHAHDWLQYDQPPEGSE